MSDPKWLVDLLDSLGGEQDPSTAALYQRLAQVAQTPEVQDPARGKKRRVNISIDPLVWGRLRWLAERHGSSFSATIEGLGKMLIAALGPQVITDQDLERFGLTHRPTEPDPNT
jgi:hypothetical protein